MTDIVEPAWLVALADQRIALISQAKHLLPTDGAIVMTSLTELAPNATALEQEHWDRACDACGTYCPVDSEFYTGHIVRTLSNGVRVTLTLGVCPVHAAQMQPGNH